MAGIFEKSTIGEGGIENPMYVNLDDVIGQCCEDIIITHDYSVQDDDIQKSTVPLLLKRLYKVLEEAAGISVVDPITADIETLEGEKSKNIKKKNCLNNSFSAYP